jgi:hypothetical protein
MATMLASDSFAQDGVTDRQISRNWNDQRDEVLSVKNVDAIEAVFASVVQRNGGAAPLIVDGNKSDRPSTAAKLQPGVLAPSVINIPNAFQAKIVAGRSVNTLQEWEGLVQTVGSENFTARLRDLTVPGHPEEIAEISFDGIDPNDLSRVKIGAVFHLIVGYTRRNGSQRLETFTYFRRHLPSGRAAANKLADLLDMFEDDAD